MYGVGIDTGGALTDLAAVGEDGSVAVAKHPSTFRAPVDAFVGVIDKSSLTENEGGVERITHSTTVATNAVIQRHGAPIVPVTTRGLEYVPLIQRLAGLSSGLAVREAQRRSLDCGAGQRGGVRPRVCFSTSNRRT